MTKKLFVGGLSWGTTDEQLKAAFEAFGATEAKVILDQETGRSRGFGFVTCSDDDAAKRALGELDGSELDGRTIRVNAAEEKPRPQRSGGGDSRSGGGGGSRSGGGGSSRSGGGGYSGGGGRPRQPSAPSRRSGGGGDRGPRRDGDDKFARRRSSAQKSRGGRDSSHSDSDGDYDIDQDY
ncbi:MAG: RNA-binding protein [Planctomycetota bacterium]|nr:RNA-binding protein [Planctomycetota bacterium]